MIREVDERVGNPLGGGAPIRCGSENSPSSQSSQGFVGSYDSHSAISRWAA